MSGPSSLRSFYPPTLMQSNTTRCLLWLPALISALLHVGCFVISHLEGSLMAQRAHCASFPPGCSAMLTPYSLTTTGNSWGRFPPENSYRPSLARGSGKPQHPAVLGLSFAYYPGQCLPCTWQKELPFTATEAISPAVPHPKRHPASLVLDPPNHSYH